MPTVIYFLQLISNSPVTYSQVNVSDELLTLNEQVVLSTGYIRELYAG